MRQRLIGLAGIDHSGNRAEFEAGRYGEQQFRTVLDIESHAIAIFHAARLEIMRHLIGFGIQFAPTDLPVFKLNGNGIRAFFGMAFQIVNHRHFVAWAGRQKRFQTTD